MSEKPTKPYLVRAIFEWCIDCGYTPYIAVFVDDNTQVPRQYVRDNQVVLDISYGATKDLVIGNEIVSFRARFSGVGHDISIPVDNILAIYSRETGRGMNFDLPTAEEREAKKDKKTPTLHAVSEKSRENPPDEPPKPPKGGRPVLTRIK